MAQGLERARSHVAPHRLPLANTHSGSPLPGRARPHLLSDARLSGTASARPSRRWQQSRRPARVVVETRNWGRRTRRLPPGSRAKFSCAESRRMPRSTRTTTRTEKNGSWRPTIGSQRLQIEPGDCRGDDRSVYPARQRRPVRYWRSARVLPWRAARNPSPIMIAAVTATGVRSGAFEEGAKAERDGQVLQALAAAMLFCSTSNNSAWLVSGT